MADMRRRLARLEAGRLCPVHQQPYLCFRCDLQRLPAAEWDELACLLEQAGYLARKPYESAGMCWRCHRYGLACVDCLAVRGVPPEVERMNADALDRLHALGAKLIPPWLST
jgi:hypothetical protein